MRAIAVVLAALALASCGSADEAEAPRSEGQTAAPAKADDPCGLVTTAEVEAAIGEKIVSATPGDGGCIYATEAAQAASVTVESDLEDGKGAMDIARQVAGTLGDMGAAAAGEGGASGRDVNAMLSEQSAAPNLGDEAFFGANSQLSVRKGNSYVAVQPPIMRSTVTDGNPMLTGEERRQMAIRIANHALARLP